MSSVVFEMQHPIIKKGKGIISIFDRSDGSKTRVFKFSGFSLFAIFKFLIDG